MNSITNGISNLETTTNSASNLSNGNHTPRNHICRPHLVPYGPPIETVQNMSIINRYLINLNDHNYFYNVNTSVFYASSIKNRLYTNSNNPHKLNVDLNFESNQTNSTNIQNSDNSDNLNLNSSARKLETIAHCVDNIFENNFKEVKKNLNSAYRVLRDARVRLHLCKCLEKYVKRNQVILNNEQFEYLCKLLNEALLNDSRMDENGVAYAILPLTSAFYRKLNNCTVDQCIYTRLQQHDVWSNIQFWEMAFYTDVQKSLRPVYLTNEEFFAEQERENNSITNYSTTTTPTTVSDCTNSNPKIPELNLNLYQRPVEKTALEICGEQMERSSQMTDEQKESFIINEQGIIRSHVLHYITQMVNMKIPFDINIKNKKLPNSEPVISSSSGVNTSSNNNNNNNISGYSTTKRQRKNSTSNQTNTNQSQNPPVINLTENVIDTESLNAVDYNSLSLNKSQVNDDNNSIAASDDSGYEPVNLNPKNNLDSNENRYYADECAPVVVDMGSTPEYMHTFGELGINVWKFVRKFVDRVCMEGGLSDSQRQLLHNNLAEVISLQIQMLETVYSESKRVPIRSKPKLDQLKPDYMLTGEFVIEPTPLRCYLIPDGREEVCGVPNAGTVLLPAEGALILTNYRIIFRGIPVNDSLMSDSIITRSFPIASLIKEKKIGNQLKLLNHTNDLFTLHDGLQMRSCTFQLLKIYFDEESSAERVERFRNVLLKQRYPQSVMEFFCLAQCNHNNNFKMQNVMNLGIYLSNTNNNAVNDGLNHHNSYDSTTNGAEIYNSHVIGLKSKEKGADVLKHFAKNTLRKAGLMPRSSNNSRKNVMQAANMINLNNGSSSMAARTPETVRKIRHNNSITSTSSDTNTNGKQIDSDDESLSSNFFEKEFF